MISRGDIYYADLSPVIGSEQGGIRPVLVLQKLLLLPRFRQNSPKILFPRMSLFVVIL